LDILIIKMKVVEIKEELRKRKLSTSGVKAVLEARLNEAIEKEQAEKEAAKPEDSVDNEVAESPAAETNEPSPVTAVPTSNDAVENPQTAESNTDDAAMDMTKNDAPEVEKSPPDTEMVENGDLQAENEVHERNSHTEEKQARDEESAAKSEDRDKGEEADGTREGHRERRRDRSRNRDSDRHRRPTGRVEEGKLYLGNLSYRTEERDLWDDFERFGKIADVFIPRERGGYRSRGFGFVTFVDSRDAEYARDEMQGREVDGRRLRIELARARPPLESRGRRGRRRDSRSRSRERRRSRSNSRGRRRRSYSR